MTEKQKKTETLLGPLIEPLPRTREHDKRALLLIARLQACTSKIGKPPKIFKAKPLYDRDCICIEGENGFNREMSKLVCNEFPEAEIEPDENGSCTTKIYLPVSEQGLLTRSPWLDFFVSFAISLLALYLLYYFMSS